MDKEKFLTNVAQSFYERFLVPQFYEKGNKPFVVALIGIPGSGRTTIAKRLKVVQGMASVLVSANDARSILRDNTLEWGENVRILLRFSMQKLFEQGYGVVLDGNALDEKDRQNIESVASQFSVPVFYVRVMTDSVIAAERMRKKYEDENWISTPGEIRVNTAEKMVQNVWDRAEFEKTVDFSKIPLFATIDNNGTIEQLHSRVDTIIKKI
ncbi:MAG: AAA family ATPase [Parcubacteria group bacterium]|nr:AAA family ATPase [Parcubacteria group bacterium]